MLAVVAATVASLMHQCFSAVHSQRQAERFVFSNDRQSSLQPFDGLLPPATTQDNVQVTYHMNDPFALKSVSSNMSGISRIGLIASDILRLSNQSTASLGTVAVSNNQMAFYRQLLSVDLKGALLADRYLHASANGGAYIYAYSSSSSVHIHMIDVDMGDIDVDLRFEADLCDMTADLRFVYLLCKQSAGVSVSQIPLLDISAFSTKLLGNSVEGLSSLSYGTDNSSYYLSYDSGVIIYRIDGTDYTIRPTGQLVGLLACSHRLLVVGSSAIAIYSPLYNKSVDVKYRIRQASCTLDSLHMIVSNASYDSILLTLNTETLSSSALILSPNATSVVALRMELDAVMNVIVVNSTFSYDNVQFVQTFIDGPHITIDYSQASLKQNYSLSTVINGSTANIELIIDAYSYSFADRYRLQNDRSYDIHINGMLSAVHSNNSNVRLSQDNQSMAVDDSRQYYRLHMHDRFTCGSTVDGIYIVDTSKNSTVFHKDYSCHVESIDNIRYQSSTSFHLLCTDYRLNQSTQTVHIIDSQLVSHSIPLNLSASATSIVAVSGGYLLSFVSDFRVHTCRLATDYSVSSCTHIFSNASYVHAFSLVDGQLFIASSYVFDRTVHIHALVGDSYSYQSVLLDAIDYRSTVTIDCSDRRCVRVNGIYMHVIDLLALDHQVIDMSSSIHGYKLTLTDCFGLAAYAIDHKDTGIYKHRFVYVVVDLLSPSLLSTVAYDSKYMPSIAAIGDDYYSYMNGSLKQVSLLSMHIDDINSADDFSITDIFNNNRVIHFRDIYGLYDYSYIRILTLGISAAILVMLVCTCYKHLTSRKQQLPTTDLKSTHYSTISGSMSSQLQ